MKRNTLFLLALLIACLVALLNPASALLAFTALALFSLVTAPVTAQLRATLSVNELLMDVVKAFKVALFDPLTLTTDFSSATAAKGDVITGHISTLPVTQDYDATTGFNLNAATAESLLTDVPITLDQLKHVPIKVNWLTQLASKVDLTKTIQNSGYAVAKFVIDDVITKSLSYVSNSVLYGGGWPLDALGYVQGVCNQQKMANFPRHLILNTALATALSNDDRTKSKFFYGEGLTDNEGT